MITLYIPCSLPLSKQLRACRLWPEQPAVGHTHHVLHVLRLPCVQRPGTAGTEAVRPLCRRVGDVSTLHRGRANGERKGEGGREKGGRRGGRRGGRHTHTHTYTCTYTHAHERTHLSGLAAAVERCVHACVRACVYSGICLFVMLTARLPFHAESLTQVRHP